MYEDGADGISTFNWYERLRHSRLPNQWTAAGPCSAGDDADVEQPYTYPLRGAPSARRRYQEQPGALPPRGL